MNFIQSLRTLKDTSYACIAFKVSQYSPLFAMRLYAYCKAHLLSLTLLDVTTYTFNELRMTCDTSFLGMRNWYWLKDFHLLDANTRYQWLEYLLHYQGPHTLFLFDTGTGLVETSFLSVISLPATLSKDTYKQYYELFFEGTYDPEFTTKLFEKKEGLSLDEAFLLMSYQGALGRKYDDFFSLWLAKIVVPEKSLFTLSQYFFAQQAKDFFTLWAQCSNDYPDEFWIAYWSEQVWQAALFVLRANKEGIQVAKKHAYRLPFSFINKDWRKYTFEYLVTTHDALYRFDYQLKNGGPSYGLDLWYSQFLLEESKKS